MSNKVVKVGVLVIGRKRPGFDQEWNLIMRRRAAEALESLGFTSIGAANPVVDDQTISAALGEIRAAGCDSLIILQPSLGHGQLCAAVAQQWPGPVVLWATPERQESPQVSSCSLVAAHLWASTLRQANHPFELVYGDPNDDRTRQSLKQAILLCQTTATLKRSKLGLVGTHAPGFIDMATDPFLLRSALGIQLHTLSLPQFIDHVRAIDESPVKDDVARVREMNLPMTKVTADDLAMNSRYYLALRDLMHEEQLDGLALQCWPELPNMLGQWPYLALARLTEEGRAMAMEGDVDAAVTAQVGNALQLGPGFITDWLEHDDNSITFWHPGIAPISMLETASLANHFNIVRPLVIDGPIKVDQPVTIVRLWQCDGQYNLAAFEGQTIPMRRKLTGNTSLVAVPDRNVREYFEELCHAGMPHHVTVFFGHHADALKRLARMMKVKTV